MAIFDNILHRLLPDQLTHPGLELAHRRQPQHIFVLLLALCTLVLNGQVGQAGIGAINQMQVSNYTPVPQHAVIAKPQMLLLVLDQHLNRPSPQIVGYDCFARNAQVIRNQSNTLPLAPPTREDYLYHTKFVQPPGPFGQTVRPSRTQTCDRKRLPLSAQEVRAIGAEFVLSAVDEEVAIGLAYADKMKLAGTTGSSNDRTEIVRVEQDSRRDALRQSNIPDRLGGQFRQRPEGSVEFWSVAFLEIQPRAPRDRYTAIPQADLQDRVAGTVLARGMMVQLTDAIHFPGVLEGLGIVDDKIAFAAVFPVQTAQGVDGDLLNDGRLVPVASPEEFAVVGSMCGASQQFGQAFDSAAMPDSDGHHQAAEVLVCRCCEASFQWMKKCVDFSWDFTDGNHAAIPQISVCWYNSYRQKSSHFFCATYHREIPNRSV